MVFGTNKIDGEYKNGVFVSVQNPSFHTVHLSNFSILYPYKQTNLIDLIRHAIKYRRLPLIEGWVHCKLSLYDFEDNFPISLEPGKSHSFLIPQEIVEKILQDSVRRELRAVVQDQLWRNKYSRKFKVD